MYRDILVIGAGVLGLSSAYHLKESNPGKSVLVIDKLGGPGQGNTAKSAGGYRNVLASRKNRQLSESTIDWFFHLEQDLGYDIKLTKIGYLWLLTDEQYSSSKSVIEKMSKNGVQLRFFEEEELGRMVPFLNTGPDEDKSMMGLDPIHKGVMGVRCGTVDTDALSKSYEDLFLKAGGEVRYNTEANRLLLKPVNELGLPGEPFVWQDAEVSASETQIGTIEAETIIVACGVWSERLLTPIGVDPLMRPKKRVMYVFQHPKLEEFMNVEGFNPHGTLPLTHIPSAKAYIKPDLSEKSLWLACADDFGRKYGLEDEPEPDKGLYENNVYHAITPYFPSFKDVRPLNMWAGQRAVNGYDLMPVVVPGPGFIYVGAATGNGILKSDALGRVVAGAYQGEESIELFGGQEFRVSDLGIKNRDIERESFKI